MHWVTGRDGEDVSQVAASADSLAPGGRARRRPTGPPPIPTSCWRSSTCEEWSNEHGPLPDGGWLLYRTGWDARSDDQEEFLNADETGPHTPGISAGCAPLARRTRRRSSASGVETVGTDAGAAHAFDPPFPCHSFLLGAGKYGLTQLRNLDRLPPTGAVLIASPLPIVGGSGSPARVLALVER